MSYYGSTTHAIESSLDIDVSIHAIIAPGVSGDLENPPEYPLIKSLTIKLGELDITAEIGDHQKARFEDDILADFLERTTHE